MKFGLTDVLDRIAPWELIVTIDGKDFPTRRPAVFELAEMRDIASMSDEDGVRLIEGFFIGEARPDVRTWSKEACLLFLGTYVNYLKDRLPKNISAVVAEVNPATTATAATASAART